MKLSKAVITLMDPFVARTWESAVTQAHISSTNTLNKGPLYEKALKRMQQVYPDEILKVHGILDEVEEAKREAP